ncbi:hypothetical protein ACHMW4_22130 [Mesorhizobium sp. UC22_110]|uniref:hypothetical protein n=1 Tax=unclassified Mesorhizobium TaxID=325217 RepID=UPI003670A447
MTFENTILNTKNVFRIMSATLLIPAILDVVSGYLGFRIPWYATATLLILFMYAREADANAQRWEGLYAELERRDLERRDKERQLA